MGNKIERMEVAAYGVTRNDDGSTDVTWVFLCLHILAISSLLTSLLVSVGVITYLIKTGAEKNIFKRPIGERLVVYLAVSDLFYSFAHTLDHAYMLAQRDNPPIWACRAMAFLLQMFILVQSIIVLFTAFNAFWMVVKEKKIDLGPYDWKLLSVAIGLPALIGFIGCAVPFLGPGGAWCLADMGYSWGAAINNVYGIGMVLVFAINMGSYGLVYVKIEQAAKKMGGEGKYTKTAKMMMLFVVVYLIQWWPFTVQALWSFAEPPHYSIYLIAVFFCNTGGIFNFLAYTFIRKRYQKVDAKDAEKTMATKTTTVS